MRLIREPHAEGYFAQRSRTDHHEMASFLQPPFDDINMRWFAKCPLEHTREMSRASPRDGAQILDTNRSMQVLVDKGAQLLDLPARQSRPSGPFRARLTLDLVL